METNLKKHLLMNKWHRHWWIPLFIGTMIYLLFRSESLLYNRLIGTVFHPIATPESVLQQLIVYSLPDGLWALSYTMLILKIRGKRDRASLIWSMIIPVIGICSEIAQFYFIIPGTFDIFDLVMYISLPLIAIIFSK